MQGLSLEHSRYRFTATRARHSHAPPFRHALWPRRAGQKPPTVCKAMDRDPFTGIDSFFSREMAAMDRDMAQMESEIGRMMARTRQMELDATRQADEALSRAQQGTIEPGVQIRRSEERGVNSYRYHQSITISSGPSYVYAYATPAPTMAPSPLLFMAALMAGAYASLAAAFATNAHLTTYKTDSSWRLALLWPVLLVTSRTFRAQFWAAVRGKQARIKDTEAGKESSSSGL